jgi:pyrroline-5-carboxylate reductase
MSSESTPEAPTVEPDNLRIAILGLGKMGGILAQGFLRANLLPAANLTATVARADRERTPNLGIALTTDNLAAAQAADIILLAIKPYQIVDVLEEIAPALPGKLVISVAASITTATMEHAASGMYLDQEIAVIRAMPNTPAKLGAGMTAICRGQHVTDAQLALAERIFATVGRTVTLDEKLIDAATGLSGSGPAYLYIVIDALAEAGVSVGLPRETATLLAAQTAYGAARMVLETGLHPAQLKDQVTTPAGTTIAGIQALEEGKLRATLIQAVKRSVERAKELSGS